MGKGTTSASTTSGSYSFGYTSNINTVSTANVPNELRNLGFNGAFIATVMQTLTSLIAGTPIPTNPAITTINVPNDSTPIK